MNTRESLLDQYGPYFHVPDAPEERTLEIADSLMRSYEEPGRYYHNLDHFSDMAEFADAHRSELKRPREMMWAILGHDSEQILERALAPGESEIRSAARTTKPLSPYLKEQSLARITRKIMSTARHEPDGTDPDQLYLIDADLGILGSDPEKFDEYDQNIRKEYAATVSDHLFNQGRLKVLERFTERAEQGTLYLTEVGQAAFGALAIENLTRKTKEYQELVADQAS